MGTREDRERRIKEAIADIAQRPRSVQFSEIDWVMNHLRDDLSYAMKRTGQDQHFTYVIGDLPPFQVCSHNAGRKEVKPVYVHKFLARMADLELI